MRTSWRVGCRCFNDIINTLLEVTIESTADSASTVLTSLQSAVSTIMTTGMLSDPLGIQTAIQVDMGGVTDDDIVASASTVTLLE